MHVGEFSETTDHVWDQDQDQDWISENFIYKYQNMSNCFIFTDTNTKTNQYK